MPVILGTMRVALQTCTACGVHKHTPLCKALSPAPFTRQPFPHRQEAMHVTRVSSTDGEDSATDAEASKSAPGRVTTGGAGGRKGFIRPDDTEPMRLERIERLGDEAWAGVAAIDRGEAPTSLGRAAILAGGDAAAVLLFAAIGRGSHAELNGLAGILATAWPFLAGWYTGAALTGGYGAAAQGHSPGAAVSAAAKSWAVAIPLALALRSVAKGAPPPLPFIAVASVATAVLLIGWRAAFAALSPQAPPGGKTGDKAGNPLEFLSLLGSLTKRW